MIEVIDIRCPVGAKNLLLRSRVTHEETETISDGNLIEISCRDCTRSQRKEMADAGMPTGFRVIHRFFLDGQLCESIREAI